MPTFAVRVSDSSQNLHQNLFEVSHFDPRRDGHLSRFGPFWSSSSSSPRPLQIILLMAPDLQSFNHCTARLKGRTYHYVDEHPTGCSLDSLTTLLCVHGFPDLWCGWQNQIHPWAAKYRVVVPDMLGYGGTDAPENAEDYSTKRLSADLAALLDYIHVEKAVILGHDWGAATTWRFAQWYPERTLALVCLSIPFTPAPRRYLSLEEAVKRYPQFGYQLYLADAKSETEIEANLEFFLKLMFKKIGPPKLTFWREGELQKILMLQNQPIQHSNCLLDEAHLRYYVQQFRQKGMQGPLSYYRTTKIRFEEESAGLLPATISPQIPVLFFWGTADPTCSEKHVMNMQTHIPDLKSIKVDGMGHWLMREAPLLVTSEVLEWLNVVLKETRYIRGRL